MRLAGIPEQNEMLPAAPPAAYKNFCFEQVRQNVARDFRLEAMVEVFLVPAKKKFGTLLPFTRRRVIGGQCGITFIIRII